MLILAMIIYLTGAAGTIMGAAYVAGRYSDLRTFDHLDDAVPLGIIAMLWPLTVPLLLFGATSSYFFDKGKAKRK